MAERKSPMTTPQIDDGSNIKTVLPQKHLNKEHFANVIRYIKIIPLDRVKVLQIASKNHLDRLGVNTDPSAAQPGLPKGSSQGDMGSLNTWMGKVVKGDRKAISQIVAIHATCVARST